MNLIEKVGFIFIILAGSIFSAGLAKGNGIAIVYGASGILIGWVMFTWPELCKEIQAWQKVMKGPDA